MTNKDCIEILLVDDEAAGRGVLKKLLNDILQIPFNISEANSVDSAYQVIQATNIDLVFLDIQMPVKNGFELLRMLPVVNFQVIFVTGFDNYAITAFRFNALDYLLKPVDIIDLKNAVNKALININEKLVNTEQPSSFLTILPEKTSEKKIAVHVKEKVLFLPLPIISHINAVDNYCEIITFSHEKFTTPRLLKEFEIYLEDVSSFIRINRSIIVNVAYIKSYTKDFPCFIEMKTGEEFEISRRKKTEILSQLELL